MILRVWVCVWMVFVFCLVVMVVVNILVNMRYVIWEVCLSLLWKFMLVGVIMSDSDVILVRVDEVNDVRVMIVVLFCVVVVVIFRFVLFVFELFIMRYIFLEVRWWVVICWVMVLVMNFVDCLVVVSFMVRLLVIGDDSLFVSMSR